MVDYNKKIVYSVDEILIHLRSHLLELYKILQFLKNEKRDYEKLERKYKSLARNYKNLKYKHIQLTKKYNRKYGTNYTYNSYNSNNTDIFSSIIYSFFDTINRFCFI